MRRSTRLIAALAVLCVAGLATALAWSARINGTARADVLRGTAAADKIYGKAGNDRLYGLGGNDLLVGGPGVDRVFCGAGRDTVQAEARDKVARDCENVKRPGGPKPPPPTTVVEFRACGNADARPEGGAFWCGTNRANTTFARPARLYCTARIVNGFGKHAVIAFVRGGAEVTQTDEIPITREDVFTVYGFVDNPPAGSWGCRTSVHGAMLSEINFTIG